MTEEKQVDRRAGRYIRSAVGLLVEAYGATMKGDQSAARIAIGSSVEMAFLARNNLGEEGADGEVQSAEAGGPARPDDKSA